MTFYQSASYDVGFQENDKSREMEAFSMPSSPLDREATSSYPPTVYIQSPPAQDGYSPAMYDNPDTICPPDQPTGNWPPSAILSPQSHNPPGFQYPPSGDTFRFGSMLQQSSLGEVVQQVGGFFPMADDGRDARAPMTRPTKVRPNRPKDDPGCACCVIA